MFQIWESINFLCYEKRKVVTFCFYEKQKVVTFCFMKNEKWSLSLFQNIESDVYVLQNVKTIFVKALTKLKKLNICTNSTLDD